MRVRSTSSPPTLRRPAGRVHADGADLERAVLRVRAAGAGRARLRSVARPPQHRPDPRGHLARAEGLDDVVVGAELEADDAVGLLAAGGEHDDRDLGALAERAGDVVARPVGELHVEEDEVGHLARGLLDRVGDRSGHTRVEPLAVECLREGFGDRGLVLDHEDGAPARHLR